MFLVKVYYLHIRLVAIFQNRNHSKDLNHVTSKWSDKFSDTKEYYKTNRVRRDSNWVSGSEDSEQR